MTDSVQVDEPQFAVGSLGDLRAVVVRNCLARYSIGIVENKCLNRPLGVSVMVYCRSPGVYFGARNAHKAARHKEPECMVVILDHPMNRITGQSVLAGQRGSTATLQPAESALGGGPDGAVGIELKIVDCTIAKPIGCFVGCADLAITEVQDTALIKSNP